MLIFNQNFRQFPKELRYKRGTFKKASSFRKSVSFHLQASMKRAEVDECIRREEEIRD